MGIQGNGFPTEADYGNLTAMPVIGLSTRSHTMEQPPRILAGHKQMGKRFVTPFNQLELVKETRYVERIMPELLWMDMINNLYDYRCGIETAMSLCSQVRDAIGASDFTNFTVASKFATVTEDERGRARTIDEFALHLLKPEAALLRFQHLVRGLGLQEGRATARRGRSQAAFPECFADG